MGFDEMMELTGANVRACYLDIVNPVEITLVDNPKRCIWRQIELLGEKWASGFDSVYMRDKWDRIVEWVIQDPKLVRSAWAG